MNYYVYPLHFITPLHIGSTQVGGDLEKIQVVYSSDTLYSALCIELSKNTNVLDRFRHWVSNGDLCFSSLFPFYIPDEGDGELTLYVPKPLQPVVQYEFSKNYQDIVRNTAKVKENKRKQFVRVSSLCNKIDKSIDINKYEAVFTDIFNSQLHTKVNARGEQPEPYYVGSLSFSPHGGLYFIAGFSDENVKEQFEHWLELLSFSGIGGKRSSGYGKFVIGDLVSEVFNDEFVEDDIRALYEMLHNPSPSFYLQISSTIPNKEEVTFLKDGYIALDRRSGFIQSNQQVPNTKRLSNFSIKEGSCVQHPLRGSILDVTPQGFPHKVERCGIAMQLGVNLHE